MVFWNGKTPSSGTGSVNHSTSGDGLGPLVNPPIVKAQEFNPFDAFLNEEEGYLRLTSVGELDALQGKHGATQILARDGIYSWGSLVVGDTPFLDVCTLTYWLDPKKYGEDEHLAYTVEIPREQAGKYWLHGKKMPYSLWEQIEAFFHAVFKKHRGAEAFVALFYNPHTREWKVGVPSQEVGGSGVEYTAVFSPRGFYRLGDAHSHGYGSAYHSSIDDTDDTVDALEGIHCVVGSFGSPGRSYAASVVINGIRTIMNIDAFVEFPLQPEIPFPPEWMAGVTCKKYKPWTGWKKTVAGGGSRTKKLNKAEDDGKTLDLNDYIVE